MYFAHELGVSDSYSCFFLLMCKTSIWCGLRREAANRVTTCDWDPQDVWANRRSRPLSGRSRAIVHIHSLCKLAHPNLYIYIWLMQGTPRASLSQIYAMVSLIASNSCPTVPPKPSPGTRFIKILPRTTPVPGVVQVLVIPIVSHVPGHLWNRCAFQWNWYKKVPLRNLAITERKAQILEHIHTAPQHAS